MNTTCTILYNMNKKYTRPNRRIPIQMNEIMNNIKSYRETI